MQGTWYANFGSVSLSWRHESMVVRITVMCSSWRISRISCNIADHINLLKDECVGVRWCERYSRSCTERLCLVCALFGTGRPCHSILLRFEQNQNYFRLIFLPIEAMQQLLCVNYVDKLCLIYCACTWRCQERESEIDLHHHVMGACVCGRGRLCLHDASAWPKHM